MKEEKLGKYLNELADATAEPVRAGLAENIKHRIPHGIRPHRKGMNTVNIIIDLRIGKFAAAAVIILTMVLCANFLGGTDAGGESIFKDGKLLVEYIFGAGGRSELLAGLSKYEYLVRQGRDVVYYGDSISEGLSKYEHLVRQGRDVVYYGDSIDPADSNAVLMHWKLSEGKYGVIFSDLRSKTISAEELVKLQAQMLQKK